MSIWIARDKEGGLWVYPDKPIRLTNRFESEDVLADYFPINSKLYPEVTWENSPKELVVKGE